jgi:DNA-binding response OmpR family regulator
MAFPQHPRRRRILIVDDHADTRELLERLLSRRFEVVTAGCFDSALAAAERSAPDIVISDIGLPGRDGVVLMRELRRRYGISGIAVTGHPIENTPAFRDAGFVNWLRKPIQLNELLDALTAAQLEPRGAEAARLSTT